MKIDKENDTTILTSENIWDSIKLSTEPVSKLCAEYGVKEGQKIRLKYRSRDTTYIYVSKHVLTGSV